MARTPSPMVDTSPAPARFLASARKYRPQTFGDLVGQEHVARTLSNAIARDRLTHAYLFSGPRGVGKTTAARLLAKAINCETDLSEREGAEPCRTCNSCRAFEQGRDLNVIEIDAASNNSVDDIRELRETVRIPPQGSHKKVYILDEVHMLSTQAFNAFLKTLEEPPPHALFIFATTEPHKVIPTILSRCQRFDFRRISTEDAVERLREIAAEENVTADDASLHLLGRKGDGALRDSLSLFDQAVAICGNDLRIDELSEALGVVEVDLFFESVDLIGRSDTASLLALVDRVVRRGYDLAEFVEGLSEHLRHLYVVVSTGTTELLAFDSESRERYAAAAEGHTEPDLLRKLMLLEETERNLRTSPQPRLTVELAMLKLAHLESAADLRELIDRLEGADPSGAPPTPAPAKTEKEASPTPVPNKSAAPKSAAEPAAPYTPPPPREEPPSEPPGDDPPPPPPSSGPGSAPAAGPESRPDEIFGTPALSRRRPRPGDGNGSTASAVTIESVGEADDPALLAAIRTAWPRVVAGAESLSPSLGGHLSLAQVEGAPAGRINIAVPHGLARQTLTEERASIESILAEILGEQPPRLSFVVRAESTETATESDPFEIVRRMRHEHPVLKHLFERFGAEIVWT